MRHITKEDTDKYKDMVNMYINKYFIKNWSEASFKTPNMMLGNSGYSIEDIRQTLMMEVVVGLNKYKPNFRTPEGKSVKESTFIYRHLFFRSGSLAKKLCSKKSGYGIWNSPIEMYLENNDEY